MRIVDFYFDDVSASSKGFTLCSFNGGIDGVSLGSDFSASTTKSIGTNKHYFHGASYDDPIVFSLQMCKFDKCISSPISLNGSDLGVLSRWLSQDSGFNKLELITENMEHLFLEAYASLKRIDIAEDTVGIEVRFTANSSFCKAKEICEIFTLDEKTNYSHCVYDLSDKIGYQYPSIVITVLENGDLKLHNSINNKTTKIKNCKIGEVIYLSGETQIVSSVFDTHKLYNDFNFVFPKIENKKFDRDNVISSNIKVKIELKYSPIRMIGGVV